ncbi:response regulator [Rheinheimera sp. 1928-s]|uniref:response regulator n=1 Tax=Rheinheimera sp. 1928-s TaxID=3033803 RepID=UPI002608BF67|nr:response regulator [Rheinheimera sp. 1928-s]MDF3126358.1 response regulator [Rheinheimera sp. 1928-s]
MNLLFAEDDVLLAQLFQLQAQQSGYAVCWVENGDAAIQQALTYQHDLILMDVQMPILDGISAMQLLRQLGFDRPIVAMSAEEVTETGFDLVLKKPLHWQQVQQQLAQFEEFPSVALQVPAELKEGYICHVEQSLKQLEQLASQGMWSEFAAIVHQFKGSAGSFGLDHISELAHQFQTSWNTLPTEQKLPRATWFLEQCKACKLK